MQYISDTIFDITKNNVLVDTAMPKAMFYEHDALKAKDRAIIKRHVESMRLVGLLNKDHINIPEVHTDEFLYEEIYIVEVKPKSRDYCDQIAHYIHKTIPNPVIIVFDYKSQIQISCAVKRRSKLSKDQSVITDTYDTDWFSLVVLSEAEKWMLENVKIDALPWTSLHDWYETLCQRLLVFNLAEIIQIVPKGSPPGISILRDLQKKHDDLKSNIQTLQNTLDKEKSFAERMNINEKLSQANQDFKETITIITNTLTNTSV